MVKATVCVFNNTDRFRHVWCNLTLLHVLEYRNFWNTER